jgi:hypothetical protein
VLAAMCCWRSAQGIHGVRCRRDGRLDRGKTAARLITLVRSSPSAFPQAAGDDRSLPSKASGASALKEFYSSDVPLCLQVAHRQICKGKLYCRRKASACALGARSASGDSRAMLDESSKG